MMARLTEQQRLVYEFICQTLATEHRTPTVREISNEFRWKSPNAAQNHIEYLCGKGYLIPDRRGKTSSYRVPAATVTIDWWWTPDSYRGCFDGAGEFMYTSSAKTTTQLRSREAPWGVSGNQSGWPWLARATRSAGFFRKPFGGAACEKG